MCLIFLTPALKEAESGQNQLVIYSKGPRTIIVGKKEYILKVTDSRILKVFTTVLVMRTDLLLLKI